jgi:hypothetical protein
MFVIYDSSFGHFPGPVYVGWVSIA